MQKAIVIYSSKTGFSQTYARWISEDLDCKYIPLKDARASDLAGLDVVVFGGGIYASRINGYAKFRKLVLGFSGKLVLFVTGATPAAAMNVNELRTDNAVPADQQLFYLHSGLNYEKMSFSDRLLMKLFLAMLRKKQDGTPEEQGMLDTIRASGDYTKRTYIAPLIAALQ